MIWQTIKRLYRWWRIWCLRRPATKIGISTIIHGNVIDQLCPELVEIGNGCMLSGTCLILAHDASTAIFRSDRAVRVGRTRILDRCFIGVGSVIMPGVTVGPEAIVGGNSVVTRDVPPGTVVAGSPAQLICTLEK